MAKKAELYAELKKLDKKTKLTERNTIAEIEAAIAAAQPEHTEVSETVATEEKTPENSEHTETEAESEHYAKSGKKSKKHEEEVIAQEEKEARKASHDTTPQGDAETNVKTGPKPVVRPRAERKGKNYRKLAAKIEKGKVYTLKDAVQLAVDTANTKFDSSVEIHVRLGVDPKHADQNIRATVALPNGTGKTVRVAAFVPEADAAEAKTAGADIAGEETILQALDKEVIDFEVLVATPQLMPKLGKYARLLGPRGLMPNPKSGTVSTNPTAAIKEAKGGKVEYRVDKQSIVHLGIGKVSFGADKLLQNATGFLASLNSNKPASLKGIFILSTYITTTMGPSIKVSL
jgi:large subunit ribosomal protein L1